MLLIWKAEVSAPSPSPPPGEKARSLRPFLNWKWQAGPGLGAQGPSQNLSTTSRLQPDLGGRQSRCGHTQGPALTMETDLSSSLIVSGQQVRHPSCFPKPNKTLFSAKTLPSAHSRGMCIIVCQDSALSRTALSSRPVTQV